MVNCLACNAPNTRVVQTRTLGHTIVRKRTCACGANWTTTEKPDRGSLTTAPLPISGLPVGYMQPISGPLMTYPQEPNDLATSGSDPVLLLSSSGISGSYGSSKQSDPEIVNVMSRPKTGSLFDEVLALFCAAWNARYGRPYRATSADRTQLGLALRGGGLLREDIPDLPLIFGHYLRDLAPWLLQAKHPLRTFCANGGVNQYRVESVSLSKRDTVTAASVRQFAETDGCETNGKRGR